MDTSVIIILLFCVGLAGSACNFPSDITGVWRHSFHGHLNFVNSSQFLMSIASYENVPGNCHERVNDDTVIVISDKLKYEIQPNAFLSIYVGICLKLDKIKENLYKLTSLTAELGLAEFARIKLLFSSSDMTVDGICNDNTTDTRKEYYMLAKQGSEETLTEECPQEVQGHLDLSFNSTSCSTSIDVCSDNTTLNINNTCSSAMAYSSNGTVNCIHSEKVDDTVVLWTHNNDQSPDERSTFIFTCYMINVNGGSVIGTQNPRFCDATQNATSISTGSTAVVRGASFTGSTDRCETETTTTAAATTTPESTTVGQISGATTISSGLSCILILTFVGILF